MAETLRDHQERPRHTRPFVERFLMRPVVPYTRWQRLLHRLRVCRWHRHQRSLFELLPWRTIGGASHRHAAGDILPGVTWREWDGGTDG